MKRIEYGIFEDRRDQGLGVLLAHCTFNSQYANQMADDWTPLRPGNLVWVAQREVTYSEWLHPAPGMDGQHLPACNNRCDESGHWLESSDDR